MNEHASKVLDNYLDTENMPVPHAILIEGKWGSGKTYFLQNVYEPARKKRLNNDRLHHVPFLFISLFGATSASDVELRIYKSACPAEAIAGSIAGTIALGIGEFFQVKETAKGALDKLGKKAIRRLNDFVFVFDDLERVENDAFGEIMGLINSLVAEHGRRVILVTDEEKLKALVGGQRWKEQNEKFVGRRAHIEADFESVIRVSIDRLPNGEAKTLLRENVERLLHIARISKVENLRNLNWAIHNAAAFAECLANDPDIPKAHIVRTILVVAATTLWLRSELIDLGTLKNLRRITLAQAVRAVNKPSDNEPVDPKVEKAKEFSTTFASISVEKPPVSYDFVRSFEETGVLDNAEVILWTKSQFGFGETHREASWRRLWHSSERKIIETEQALAELRKELIDRKYTANGSILHAAGLAIRQNLMGDQTLTNGEDVVSFFKRYIDDLAEDGRLESSNFNRIYGVPDSDSGLGYISRETSEFREIVDYIKEVSGRLSDRKLEARVDAILRDAESGHPEALFQLIQSHDSELSARPVLLHVPVDRLVKFMAQDMPALSAGARLLAYRYHKVRAGDALFAEIDWARNVYTAISVKLDEWKEPFRSMALHSLRDVIQYYEGDKSPDELIVPREAAAEAG